MSPQALKENNTQKQEYNIPGIMLLSVDRRAELQTYLQWITDTTERNNQVEKFKSILSQAEGKDPIKAQPIVMIIEDLLDDQLLINKQKVAAGEVQVAIIADTKAERKAEVAIIADTKAERKDEAAAGERQAAAGEKQAKLESALLKAAALESNIISNGGKSTRDSLQSAWLDYNTTLATARAELTSQGKDPRLAEAFVMLQHQDQILLHIPAANRANLQQEFASLRDGLGLQGLPTRTPAAIALARPEFTITGYNNAQLAFGTPPPLAYSSYGQIRTAPDLITGGHTVLTAEGRRYRERGVSIESPVPSTLALEKTQAQLIDAQIAVKNYKIWADTARTSVLTALLEAGDLESWAIGERELSETRANRRTTFSQFTNQLSVNPNNPDEVKKLAENMLRLYNSDSFKSLPAVTRKSIDDRLWAYYGNIAKQSTFQQEIITLQKADPRTLIQSQIANQDAIIDRNLSDINRIGLHHLGQDGYKQILTTLSKVTQSKIPIWGERDVSGLIDDTKPFGGHLNTALEATLLALIGQTRAQAYPDGTLSPEAIAKIQGLGAVSNERMKEVVRQAIGNER